VKEIINVISGIRNIKSLSDAEKFAKTYEDLFVKWISKLPKDKNARKKIMQIAAKFALKNMEELGEDPKGLDINRVTAEDAIKFLAKTPKIGKAIAEYLTPEDLYYFYATLFGKSVDLSKEENVKRVSQLALDVHQKLRREFLA